MTRYIEMSSEGKRGRYANSVSNTGTNRDSAGYCSRMIAGVEPGINERVRDILVPLKDRLEPELKYYLDGYYDI